MNFSYLVKLILFAGPESLKFLWTGCLFKKIELSESIRYGSGDPIESWLNGLLCLDVATSLPNPAWYAYLLKF